MLQKKIKWFVSLLVLTSFGASVSFIVTSCGSGSNSEPDEYSEYINDRTFSIAVKVSNADLYSIGTAWIFQRTNNLQEFEYYMATNLHVSIPFDQTYATQNHCPMLLGYNNNYQINKSLDAYLSIEYDTGWTLLGKGVNRPILVPFEESLGWECDVDFNIFRVNFGSEQKIANIDPYDYSHRIANSPLLNRLKKLNEGASDGKTITPFASSSDWVGGKNLHVGGFPMLTTNGNKAAKWTYYATKCESTSFQYTKDNPNPLDPTPLDDLMSDNVPIAILGKEISYQRNMTPDLIPGSSGSLVINDQKQAVAINYAGEMNDNGTKSIQSKALMLNCDDSKYGSQYRYNVLQQGWFNTVF